MTRPMLAACLTCGASDDTGDRAAALRWHMEHVCPPAVDIWRSDLPGGDFGWQCHDCGAEQGGYLGWGTAEAGAREHEQSHASGDSEVRGA